jgi:hypothetical protein
MRGRSGLAFQGDGVHGSFQLGHFQGWEGAGAMD